MNSEQEPDQRVRRPLTVVIPTRDRPSMLARCLETVRTSLGPDDELIVVDSASKDPSAVAAVARNAAARVVRLDIPGEARARNAGWRAARYDLIAYVDDDAWVDASWADAFAWCFAEHPDAAFITGRLEIPHGQQPRLWVSIKNDLSPAAFDRRSYGLFGHAANLAVRRAALEEVGGFDEQLGPGARFHGATEGDMFDRLLRRGLVGRYEPAALAWHDQWRSKWTLIRLDHRSGIGSGARLAKLVRSDRLRARIVAGEYFWRWGARAWVDAARHRDKFLLMSVTTRLLGLLIGIAGGLATPIRNGHYVARGARTNPPNGRAHGRCSNGRSQG